MKVFHGNILTLDSKNTIVNYPVEKNGKIADMVVLSENPYEVPLKE